MTRIVSPRYQISYPSPTLRDEPADVPGDLKRLIDAIEISAMYGQGTFAARPPFGISGRYYWCTDHLTLYYDTGAAWIEPLNREIAFAELTTNQTVIGNTHFPGTPLILFDFGAITFTGKRVVIEFFCPKVIPSFNTSGPGFRTTTGVVLVHSSTVLSKLSEIDLMYVSNAPAQKYDASFVARREFTPTAGSHQYKIGAYADVPAGGGNGNATFSAGDGTSGPSALAPMFARMFYV